MFEDLGVVLALTGAVSASMLGYILPAVFSLAANRDGIRNDYADIFNDVYGPLSVNGGAGSSSSGSSSGSSDSGSGSGFSLGQCWGWVRLLSRHSLPLGMICFGALSLVMGVVSVFAPIGRARR